MFPSGIAQATANVEQGEVNEASAKRPPRLFPHKLLHALVEFGLGDAEKTIDIRDQCVILQLILEPLRSQGALG